ncbi:MAG: AIDA repeat-containing protein, partial [Victivallales bacterium]|nr:AIDA repeat-containing protein [Victivallales bacterium]
MPSVSGRTIESDFVVDLGQTATRVTVISGGYLIVNGGTAIQTTVNSGGSMYVPNGGAATSTTVNSRGNMCVHNGGAATETTVNNHGGMEILNGGTATSTTVNRGSMTVDSGTATETTVNEDGWMEVSIGGTANLTTINRDGWMEVSIGGTAVSTTINSGRMDVSGGTATETTVNRMGNMEVTSGGTATETTVNEDGNMEVTSGGTATETTVNNYGTLHVFSGGTATETTVNEDGIMGIASGGTATETILATRGHMFVSSGGTATSTFVSSGGRMTVYEGGTVTGSLTLADGAVVSAYQGGVIDFDVSALAPNNAALVNNLSLVQGTPTYTVTVSDAQAAGDYLLAEGAAGFDQAVFVVTDLGDELDSITVGGELKNGEYRYSLAESEGTLTFTVGKAIDGMVLENAGYTVGSRVLVTNAIVNSVGRIFVSDGGTATQTTVNLGGSMMVVSGGMATETTVNFGGQMDVVSGGTATETTVNRDGRMYIDSSGTAIATTVNSRGSMYVCGGTATETTVSSGGSMHVDEYGMAVSTTVNSRGSMDVVSGGTATETTVNSGGRLNLDQSGTATSTTVSSGGGMAVGIHCTATQTTVNGGSMEVFGGTATQTTVNGGSIYVIDGTATATIVNVGGSMSVRGLYGKAISTTLNGGSMTVVGGTSDYESCTAISTTINSGGSMTVSSGGTATETTINSGGSMTVSDGGTATETTVNNGYVYVSSGGTVTGALTLADGAVVAVEAGGVIDFDVSALQPDNAVIVNNLSLVQGTPAYTVTVSTTQATGDYQLAEGAADFTGTVTVKCEGENDLSLAVGDTNQKDGGGAYAYSLAVADSRLLLTVAAVPVLVFVHADWTEADVDGQSIGDTALVWGQNAFNSFAAAANAANAATDAGRQAELYLMGGTTSDAVNLTGAYDVWITGGTTATACASLKGNGGVLHAASEFIADSISGFSRVDFDLTEWGAGQGAMLSVMPQFDGNAELTVTVSDTQELGSYVLADGADGFTGTLTVISAGAPAALSVAVGGDAVVGDNAAYSQTVTNGQLLLTVAPPDTTPPEAPVAVADITEPTNQNVTVTAVFSDDTAAKQYSLDGQTWETYTDPVVLSDNGTVQFRGTDAAGNVSDITTYEVANIDKVAPDAPVAVADVTDPTNGDVTVTATFSDDSTIKEYSLDGTTWSAYTEPVVLTGNGAVSFRGTDAAGNVSEVTTYEVTNIDKVAPEAPSAVADVTDPTSGNVTVTATFSDDTAIKEYSLDGTTWSAYTDPVILSANGAVSFRGTDAAGNLSDITTYEVTNIDKVIPEKPGFTRVGDAGTGEVVVTATWDATDAQCLYSLDGLNWQQYTAPLRFSQDVLVQFKTVDAAGNASETADCKVKLTVTPDDIVVESTAFGQTALGWQNDDLEAWADGYDVQLAIDGAGTLVMNDVGEPGLELCNAPADVTVGVKPAQFQEWPAEGKDIEVAPQADGPQVVDAETNGFADVMFGRATGVWNANYRAGHVSLPGEKAKLKGRNQIGDLFFGSDDASILLLTDDANGDVFFLDDIYSAFPEGMDAQARLAKIDEIQAGAGADVVDLTSTRFEYVGGGLTVRGGAGDDVIWANS